MIGHPSSGPQAPMRQQPMPPFAPRDAEPSQRVIRLLGERLELVEDLWQTVLRSECPPGQAERLLRLKQQIGRAHV
jgi:phosphoenolpyruvate carboxylase